MKPTTRRPNSLRLKGYDYSQAGLYFITLVTQGRIPLFGEVVKGEMCLNRYGGIVEQAWFDLPHHYHRVELGAFVVMPNHVHGIIIIDDTNLGGSIERINSGLEMGESGRGPLPEVSKSRPYGINHSLAEIVRVLKSYSAKRINLLRKMTGVPVWQRNYYDHIIRNQEDLELTWEYIEANPGRWGEDEENSER